MKESMQNPLSLKSLNHFSLVCRSVEKSLDFYQNIIGFLPIRRPGSFDFHGAWKCINITVINIDEFRFSFIEYWLIDILIWKKEGYSIMALAYIHWNVKILIECPASARSLIPKTIIFLSKHLSSFTIIISFISYMHTQKHVRAMCLKWLVICTLLVGSVRTWRQWRENWRRWR